MNLIASKHVTATVVDIDALLQDTYLLVVELRQGAGVHSGQALMTLCMEQVEHVRQQLKLGGLSQRNIDHISHAQCALLDETVLSFATGDARTLWVSEPLQAKVFNRHQAGEFLYEDMREVLREPAPDRHVLTAFQRVLMLGFRGRYRDLSDPEREQLLVAISQHITPFKVGKGLMPGAGAGEVAAGLAWLNAPLVHVLAAGVLLAATWWWSDYLLSGAIASLLPGQA